MPYVMVPVPEDLVEDVMQLVVRAAARANLTEWDAAAVKAFWDGSDELTKMLLSSTARAISNEKALGPADAAGFIQHSVREVNALVREVGERSKEEERPSLVFTRRIVETMPNGRAQEVKLLSMPDDVPGWIQEAEQAELAEIENS